MTARCMRFVISAVRNASTKPSTNGDINPYLYNRNPRNFEKLRIQKKPTGFVFDKVFVQFWHKLHVTDSSGCVTAQLIHNSGNIVVTASTNEWSIYKQLHSKEDKMAYITLARVFAERCLETGIYCFAHELQNVGKNTNVYTFLKILEEEGLNLSEPDDFNVHNKYVAVEKKPWTVLEDPN